MLCKECGKQIGYKVFSGGTCQACYNYFRKGGIVYPIPEYGRIKHDVNGKVICHICGRAFTRLGSHIKESHNMSIKEYKEKFGLCANARTTESNYSNTMRKLAYDNNMDKQLLEVGKNTRIKRNDNTLRKGKEVRLQEILDKRDRKFKKASNDIK